jgi:hypothetical protein
MITTSPMHDLASELAAKLNSGTAARETFGDTSVAFGWSEGLPPIVARFVESAKVDGLSFTGVRVKPSATPAAKVAEGATKPSAVVLESFTTTLAKYAGLATFSLEQSLSTTALLPAINATLIGQSLVAFDTDAVAALAADAGLSATGATWTSAILAGIAEVASAGQNPSVLVLAPADYAAAVQDPGAVFSADLATGVTSLFGLQLAVVVGATAGTAYVLDSRAAVAVEHVASPLFTLDPFTLADTNRARLISEIVAAFVVTQPAGVCEVTVTVGP